MGILNYKIKASELDERFLAALKSLFEDEEIVISVHYASETVKSAQTLSEMIAERDEDPTNYVIPGAVFSELADKFLEDEEFDMASEIREYKTN